MCHRWSQNKEGIILLWTPFRRCRVAVFFFIWTRDAHKSCFHRSEKCEKRRQGRKRDSFRFWQTTSQAGPSPSGSQAASLPLGGRHSWMLTTILLFLLEQRFHLNKPVVLAMAHSCCLNLPSSECPILLLENIFLRFGCYFKTGHIFISCPLVHCCVCMRERETEKQRNRESERIDTENSDLNMEVLEERHCVRSNCSQKEYLANPKVLCKMALASGLTCF